jgi:hypothetical protein
LEEDVTEQSTVIFEIYTAEAIAVCVNELGMKMPLYVIHIDMGAHIVAAQVYEDGKKCLWLIQVGAFPLRCILFTLS